jgi:hypothetical protein
MDNNAGDRQKPRVYYIYELTCQCGCGRTFEAQRSDAKYTKRCRWRLRQSRWRSRYPEKVREINKRTVATEHGKQKRREYKSAWYWRDVERSRALAREWDHTRGRVARRAIKPWELELAQRIRELALI